MPVSTDETLFGRIAMRGPRALEELPQRATPPRIASRGFSLIELLVAIGIISLLSALVLAVVSKVRLASQSTRCMANLHNMSVAFSQYAMNNDGCFPLPEASKRSWESLLQPYVNQTEIFHCPADTEIFPVVGSSYDWRDTPDPSTTLAGRPMAAVKRSDAVLAFETLPGWHGKHLMNALLSNGSVCSMSDDQCLLDLQMEVGDVLPPANASPASGP